MRTDIGNKDRSRKTRWAAITLIWVRYDGSMITGLR